MNYTAKQYSEALLDLSKHASDEIINTAVKELETMLSRQGKRSLMKEIAQHVSRSQDKEKGVVHISLTLPKRAADYAQEIAQSLSTTSKTPINIETTYDETIIAGARVLVDSQWYIDATINGRLQKLSDQLHNI